MKNDTAWRFAYERLGRVLNAEAKEHYEIIEALGVSFDAAGDESDEAFHARVLAYIAELKAREAVSVP